jgi:hypothetical protein
VKEVYLCKIQKFVVAQQCFRRKQRSAFQHYLGETASPPV